MNIQGPITSTGHDLNQLRDVIRLRDDLSMAEKFDMIAKIEEGANPIQLGIAAPAEGEEYDIGEAFSNAEIEGVQKLSQIEIGVVHQLQMLLLERLLEELMLGI